MILFRITCQFYLIKYLFLLGPGEIKVALDFNRSRHTLIVRLEEIRDVKLPAGINSGFHENELKDSWNQLKLKKLTALLPGFIMCVPPSFATLTLDDSLNPIIFTLQHIQLFTPWEVIWNQGNSGYWNPRLWNLDFILMIGNPSSTDAKSGSSLWNLESKAWNPESNTVLDYPTEGKYFVLQEYMRVKENVSWFLADHNLSHVYVKCYIVPDFKKATKRKTALHTLLRNDGGRSSSDSVASWSSEDNNLGKPSEKSRGKKFVSSLRRGSRFSSKKKRDQDQGISDENANSSV